MTDQQSNKPTSTKPTLNYLTIPVLSNYVRVHVTHDCEHNCKDSFHSVEVVHILHESRLSFVAGYPLYGRSTLTHFWGVS
jgi:hypothetical protein